MQDLHRQLWQRLEAFELDAPGASFPFTSRLASEQGWTHAEAGRVIFEYKRFLFLAVAAGHPVSPSDAIDHAWHLHLLYTRSYWRELCGEVLKCELHHEPTEGGMQEKDKFADWYQRTLESYRQHFGEEPPSEWWPSPEVRHAMSAASRWVDLKRYWIIPKIWPRFRGGG